MPIVTEGCGKNTSASTDYDLRVRRATRTTSPRAAGPGFTHFHLNSSAFRIAASHSVCASRQPITLTSTTSAEAAHALHERKNEP